MFLSIRHVGPTFVTPRTLLARSFCSQAGPEPKLLFEGRNKLQDMRLILQTVQKYPRPVIVELQKEFPELIILPRAETSVPSEELMNSIHGLNKQLETLNEWAKGIHREAEETKTILRVSWMIGIVFLFFGAFLTSSK